MNEGDEGTKNLLMISIDRLVLTLFNQKLIIIEYLVDLIRHTPTNLFHILHVRDPKELSFVFRSICGLN